MILQLDGGMTFRVIENQNIIGESAHIVEKKVLLFVIGNLFVVNIVEQKQQICQQKIITNKPGYS